MVPFVVAEALKAIDEANCDVLTKQRVRESGELPGALWHIYQAQDADRIRDFLNMVVNNCLLFSLLGCSPRFLQLPVGLFIVNTCSPSSSNFLPRWAFHSYDLIPVFFNFSSPLDFASFP